MTKQLPPKKAIAPQGKPGSLLSQCVPLSEMTDDSVHMLLYGRNRVGKTTLACQFPGPGLLVAVEATKTGGAKSVTNVPNYIGKVVHRAEDVQALGLELADLANSGKEFPFKTVVLDSGTALDEAVLAKVCGWNQSANLLKWGRVSQDEYMERSDQMRKILRSYLELPCHVIITANEKDHNAQEGAKRSKLTSNLHLESYFAAAMGGGTTRWTMDNCDYICQLYQDKEVIIERKEITLPGPKKEKKIQEEAVETGRIVRRLRMTYHPNFAAGPRSIYRTDMPEFVQADSPMEMHAKLMKVIRGEKIS